MAFDPEKYHRRSIRLKGYDYSQAGMYFITICVQDMECFFGSVRNRKMILNDAGSMVEKWYFELPNKFPDIELGHHVVMPNHFHAIIINNGKGNPNASYQKRPQPIVGADLSVRPSEENAEHNLPNGSILGEHNLPNDNILGEHIGSPLRGVVQWFKTMSTNEYIRGVKNQGWPSFQGKLWQRNYYEHIIRDQRAFQNISGYIENNPGKWEDDRFFRP
jgi:putative transposase